MTFDEAIPIVLREEGGYQADPQDRGNWTGGAIGQGHCKGTNFGISAASYPALDIAALKRADAVAIYERDYWGAAHCAAAPALLRLVLLDTAVNCGVGRAVRWLQGLTDAVPDGQVGPATIAAWAKITDARGMLEDFLWLRIGHHAHLARRSAAMRTFLPNWIDRCVRVRMFSLGA